MTPLPITAASITSIHHDIEDIRQQQVGAGRHHAVLFAENVDQFLGGAGDLDLGVVLAVLVVNGEHLAVEHDLDIAVAAGAGGAKLVRAAQLHLPGTGELDFLQVVGDHLDVGIVGYRQGLLAGNVVRHALDELFSVVTLSASLRC